MSKKTLRRYNLSIPEEIFNEVEKIAIEKDTTIVEILRRFIKLGLFAVDVEKRKDAKLVIKEKNKETEIILLY